MLVERICQQCGTTFYVKPHVIKIGSGHYCSRKCVHLARRGHSFVPDTKVERTCERCGKTFYVVPSHAARSKYCSRACHNPPLIKTCPNCGKEFRTPPKANQRYCSKACLDSSPEKSEKSRENLNNRWSDPIEAERLRLKIRQRSETENWRSAPHFQRGENHPRFKGNKADRRVAVGRYEYKQWHAAVLKKDNYTCQNCGKRGGSLQAHHIKAWAEYPELRYEVSNGIALCEDCHILIHGSKKRPMTKTCAHCGKSFRPRKSGAKFCSRSCFHEWQSHK